MKLSKIAGFTLALMLIVGMTVSTHASNYGTKAEAQALAVKAATLYQEKDDAALPEFQKKGGDFIDRDLYVFVVSKDGLFKAHGGNAGIVGKNGMTLKDITGFEIIKAFIKAPTKTWVNYKWTSPSEEGALKIKSTYIIKVGDDHIGVGYYAD